MRSRAKEPLQLHHPSATSFHKDIKGSGDRMRIKDTHLSAKQIADLELQLKKRIEAKRK